MRTDSQPASPSRAGLTYVCLLTSHRYAMPQTRPTQKDWPTRVQDLCRRLGLTRSEAQDAYAQDAGYEDFETLRREHDGQLTVRKARPGEIESPNV